MRWEDQQIIIIKVANRFRPKIQRRMIQIMREWLELEQQGRQAEIQNKFFDDELFEIITKLYATAGVSMARYVHKNMPTVRELRQVKKAIGQMGISEEWLAVVKAYLNRHGLQFTTRIIGTLREKAIEIFQQAAEEGWGYNVIAEAIGRIGVRNSEVVARTEAHRAAMVGSITGAKTLPYAVQKEWLSGRDMRTRRPPKHAFDHYYINGQVREIDQPFDTGVQTMQPGDPNTDAANTIRCRCVMNYLPKRDERGMLILK